LRAVIGRGAALPRPPLTVVKHHQTTAGHPHPTAKRRSSRAGGDDHRAPCLPGVRMLGRQGISAWNATEVGHSGVNGDIQPSPPPDWSPSTGRNSPCTFATSEVACDSTTRAFRSGAQPPGEQPPSGARKARASCHRGTSSPTGATPFVSSWARLAGGGGLSLGARWRCLRSDGRQAGHGGPGHRCFGDGARGVRRHFRSAIGAMSNSWRGRAGQGGARNATGGWAREADLGRSAARAEK